MTKRQKFSAIIAGLIGSVMIASTAHAADHTPPNWPQSGNNAAAIDAANANFAAIQQRATENEKVDALIADIVAGKDQPGESAVVTVAQTPAIVAVMPADDVPTVPVVTPELQPDLDAQHAVAKSKPHGLKKVWHVATDWLFGNKAQQAVIANDPANAVALSDITTTVSATDLSSAVVGGPTPENTVVGGPTPENIITQAELNKIPAKPSAALPFMAPKSVVPTGSTETRGVSLADAVFVKPDRLVVQPQAALPQATAADMDYQARQACADQGLKNSGTCVAAAKNALDGWYNPVVTWYPQPIDNYQAKEYAKAEFCDTALFKGKKWKASCRAAVEQSVNSIRVNFNGLYERAPRASDIVAVSTRPGDVRLMTRGSALAAGLTPQ